MSGETKGAVERPDARYLEVRIAQEMAAQGCAAARKYLAWLTGRRQS